MCSRLASVVVLADTGKLQKPWATKEVMNAVASCFAENESLPIRIQACKVISSRQFSAVWRVASRAFCFLRFADPSRALLFLRLQVVERMGIALQTWDQADTLIEAFTAPLFQALMRLLDRCVSCKSQLSKSTLLSVCIVVGIEKIQRWQKLRDSL